MFWLSCCLFFGIAVGAAARLSAIRAVEIPGRVAAFVAILCVWPLTASAQPGSDKKLCVASIVTRISPVRDDYFGTAVDDPYRWLEDWSSPEVRAWSDAQSTCARRYLDGLSDAPGIRARLTQLLTVARGTTYGSPKIRGDRLFVLRSVSNVQQPSLVFMANADSSNAAQVVLDLMQLDPGGRTSIDWYAPSDDGRLVAVSLSSGGSERGTLRIFDAATGRQIDDAPIQNVNNATAGGDLAWAPDNRGFYYTRYPQPGERPDNELEFHQRVYYHKIGTLPATDRYEIGADLPSTAAIRLRIQKATGRVIAWVQNGDSGQFRFFLREPDGRWRAFGNFGDGHFEAVFGTGDDIFVLTAAGASRGKVLRLSAQDLDFSRAQTIIPESEATLSHSFYWKDSPTIAVSGNALLLVYQTGGPSEMRVFSMNGQPLAGPALPPIANVSSVTALRDDEVLFAVESFVEPRRWIRYNLRTRAAEPALSPPKPIAGWDDADVIREFAVSNDGTRVPVTIVRLQATQTRGLLLTGYGGYRIALTPHFEPDVRMLLEQGIAYAVANLRGGSEFGEEWHRQGSLTQKQNVFDDFVAVAKYLVDRGYAPRGKLAITGASNGGLLMGATLIQQPQLAQAIVTRVGVYDSLRNELDANGVFNIPEFGTVQDERQFRALRAYSPYHNVRNSQRYPPVLFLTGANDSRVNPMHSRKMVARLQSAKQPAGPILLRTSDSTGHGAGTPLGAQVEELTDAYAFIMKSLATPYRMPANRADSKSAAAVAESPR